MGRPSGKAKAKAKAKGKGKGKGKNKGPPTAMNVRALRCLSMLLQQQQ